MNRASEILIDGISDDNDVDRIFARLEQCEPPSDMIERIMAAVVRLPLPEAHKVSRWQDLEIMAVDEGSLSAC